MPALLAAPVAGSLVDRYDRARVVALSCALATVGFGVAAVLVIDDKPLWSLAVATAAASAVATPPRPALKTLLPALARTPAELVRATAHWTGVDSAGFLFGAGAGGILIALTATGAVVAIAAGLAALTTLLAVGLPATIASEASEETDDAGLLVGVRAVLATPPLYAPFVLLIGLLVLEGATDVQLVALAIDRLGLGFSLVEGA